MTKTLTGALFAAMIAGGAENLTENAGIVNDLNVFPIPDGDTGDNMSRTIRGGVERVSAAGAGTLGGTARAEADGMLMAARGNSGVILSQFFEGVARGLEGADTADAALLGRAFAAGVKTAYTAVVTPTEGTILTVMRESTEAAERAGAADLESFFGAFIEEMYASIDRTPEKLAVLKEAGVIDSGGAGLAYIVEGMARVLRGEAPLSGAAASAETPDTAGKPDTAAAAAAFGPDSAMEFGYCTEVMLQLMADRGGMGLEAAEVSAFLSTVGDSVVAFRNGTRVKLHVHTFEPEKVLAWCRRYGEFVSVKVENMSIQHSESTVVNRFVRQTPARTERIPIGVVAVAQGDGLKELFTGFGADRIVDGQQTMNPSAEDFLNAFREVNADSVIVLPNNSNIILAARQAAELCTDSRVYVVESRSLAEGYAALTMLDLDSGDAAAVAEELNEVCRGVVTGEVTWAVRDSVVGGKTISKGDWLGLCGKELISVAPDKVSAACALADGLDLSDREVIVLIEGRDASAEERAAVAAHIRKKYPQKELYEADGGQDVYSFILALE